LGFSHLEEVTIALELRTLFTIQKTQTPHIANATASRIANLVRYTSVLRIRSNGTESTIVPRALDDGALIKAKAMVDRFKEPFNHRQWGEWDFMMPLFKLGGVIHDDMIERGSSISRRERGSVVPRANVSKSRKEA
jgi:hypothetical protein